MLFVVLRKMLQNKWLSICLLLGFTLAVATVSSIPMFTRGAAFNEYTKSLRNNQIETGTYPGGALVNQNMIPKKDTNYSGKYMETDKLVGEDLVKRLGLPVLSSARRLITDYKDMFLFLTPSMNIRLHISAMNKLEDHVKLLAGRMYTPSKDGNTIEVVVTAADMLQHKLALGSIYSLKGGRFNNLWYEKADYKLQANIVIVGVIAPKSESDLYWYYNFVQKNEYPILYMDQGDFMKKIFVDTPTIEVSAQWYTAFDYNKIKIDDMINIEKVTIDWKSYQDKGRISSLVMPMQSMFVKYTQGVKVLTSIMWLFNILILIILAFYILMISKLIIEYDKNEISLITSRGGGKLHILRGYLIQGLSIGVVALIVGPLMGILICRIIGASNSFLEFANRKAIPTVINLQVALYSFLALFIFLAVMLGTSAMFSSTTIIEYKQGKARAKNKYINLRILLSIGLLGFSIYWLTSYQSLAKRAGGVLVNNSGLPIDPLLFLNAALFIMGAGLFLTNLFPYLVRLIFNLGRRVWTPSIYTAFIQIARSAGQEQFLMLFIVLTLSIGVFSADSARTININATEKIQYQTGADITFTGDWQYQADKNAPTSDDVMAAAFGNKEAALKIEQFNIRNNRGILNDSYIEPNFKQYTSLSGVENATKVYIEESPNIIAYSGVANIKLMGIDSGNFGKVAWFRPQLLPYHWYEYLNLLADKPEGVLLSRSFEKLGYKPGDQISLRISSRYDIEVIVLDFVDYWPSFDLNIPPDANGNTDNYLIVGNLGYIFNNIPMQPYQVWMKKKPGASSTDIYKEMQDKKIYSQKFTDTDTLIVQLKKEPAMLGTNGSLTLGFILTMIICINGFVIYWVMSLKRRALQFGIMRSMGVSSRNIIGMLTFEHIITSGSAIIAGIGIGAIASRIFIPVYKLFYNSGQILLPFRIVSQRSDYIKLYAVVAVMLLIALSILYVVTKNVKVTQAVKLGED